MQWERPQRLFARHALTDQGWVKNALLHIDPTGTIATIDTNASPAANVLSFDLLLPGMANVHSHAFQRAMAGLTETASGKGHDNFWSWREVMYRFTQRLNPEHMEILARGFYIELLKHGYTAVGEFHYLHHDGHGKPYAAATELSDRIIAGGQSAGIHLTHLPVMYETGNFGGAPANDGQRRFLHTAESYLTLLETLAKRYAIPGVTLGVAPHSLRAVTPRTLRKILEALPGLGMAHCPIHMHISEQEKEVADCVAWSKQRPLEWLLDHCPVDARWCLIHATHTTADELTRLAKSGATVGLCPTTEADLGDGIFPGEPYFKAQGSFGIGSDSNVCVSPWEELRLMEYAQRLAVRKRNVLCSDATPSVGRTLFTGAAAGGAKALGLSSGKIAPGQRADLIALSMDHALLTARQGDAILDTLIFAGLAAVSDVLVAGQRVIANGTHPLEESTGRQLREISALYSK